MSDEFAASKETLVQDARLVLETVLDFSRFGSKVTLRDYQKEVALAVIESVLGRQGISLVVMFPRQSGKNELQAQLESYLLCLFSGTDAEIVKVSPTWKPQSQNAMRRLERTLKRNPLTQTLWQKEAGYIYRVGSARVYFLSAAPESNIVGATASTLLEVDEAQDVLPGKFDKEVAPMAASTNATRVFWGTAWTGATLLGRELRAAKRAEKRDGIRRVFRLNGDDVAREVPEYGKFVAEQVSRLGRSHPMVCTQYFSEEITAESGMFPAWRVALMKDGAGAGETVPVPAAGRIYAFLLDVAGQDEAASGDSTPLQSELANPRRDATALTIVEVDLSTLADELICRPTYRPRLRRMWVGVRHTRLFAEIKALAGKWRPRKLVVDATGVGAGLASFLEKAFPGQVIPFTFNAGSKSRLGWDFLGIVDTGRWKEGGHSAESELFFRQLSFCQYEIQPGVEKRMSWGVPDGARDAESGELVHDDLVISAALSAVLEDQDWPPGQPTAIIRGRDPLEEMDKGF